MSTQTLIIFLSLGGLLFILELFRRGKLTFKYAAIWLLLFSLGLVSAVFRQTLDWLAAFLGFELTSNFIFFTVLCGFVFSSLLLTIFLCEQNARNDKMAQKIGQMDFEIDQLKKKRSE